MKHLITFFISLVCALIATSHAQNTGILPTPQKVEFTTSQTFVLDNATLLYFSDNNPENNFALKMINKKLKEEATFKAAVLLFPEKPKKSHKIITYHLIQNEELKALGDESYKIEITPKTILVQANTVKGIFYGVQSVNQLIRHYNKNGKIEIPCMKITDYPALKIRGWMDDMSRGPIPTVAFVKRQIDILASFKMNALTLYNEYVVKSSFYPDVAPFDGFTHEEILELDKYAAKRHVQFIGNQQALAHAEKIFQNPFYWNLADTKYVFNPGEEKTYTFFDNMFREQTALYKSPLFNINCDESEALGSGKASEFVAKLGQGRTYVQHIIRIQQLLSKYNKRTMMWADIVGNEPELMELLPKEIMMIFWSYVPAESFTNGILPIKNAGFDFVVAPGVSCWSTVYPLMDSYLVNISNLVRDGYQQSALGMLNTAWDDSGESQFNNTWHAQVWGAEMAWKPTTETEPELARKERVSRLVDFNYRFNTHFFNTPRVTDLLEEVNQINNSTIKGINDFSGLWQPLLEFYPAQIDAVFKKENLDFITQNQKLLTKVLNTQKEVKQNADLLQNAEYAVRRVLLNAQKNLLRIAIYEAKQTPNQQSISEMQKQCEHFLNNLHALKKDYVEVWEIENRVHHFAYLMSKYDKLAKEIIDLKNYVFIETEIDKQGNQVVNLITLENNLPVFYSLDGSMPTKNSIRYKEPFVITSSSLVKVATFNDFVEAVYCEKYIYKHLGIGKMRGLNSVYSTYKPAYSGGGDNALADGVTGTDNYNDGKWQGYQGVDADIDYNFGSVISVNEISARFIQHPYDWILSPKTVEIHTSTNGTHYTLYKTFIIEITDEKANYINTANCNNLQLKTQYLKVVIKNPGALPNWHQAPGHPSYIFCDEIIIR